MSVMVFLSWSCSIALFSLVLLALAKNLFNSGADRTSEVAGEKSGFESFRRSRLGRSLFFGSALDNSAPGGAWYGLASFE